MDKGYHIADVYHYDLAGLVHVNLQFEPTVAYRRNGRFIFGKDEAFTVFAMHMGTGAVEVSGSLDDAARGFDGAIRARWPSMAAFVSRLRAGGWR